MTGDELRIISTDGRQFATYVELAQAADQERERAEHESLRAEQERQRADRLAEKLRAAGIEPDV